MANSLLGYEVILDIPKSRAKAVPGVDQSSDMRGKIEEAKTMAKKKIINDAAKLKELDESDLMGLTGGF